MIYRGAAVIKKTATGSTRRGQVVYVHPSGAWYTARFPCPDGQGYHESYWTQKLKTIDYSDPAVQAERVRESQRQSVLRREFRYGL